jgi:hypothetical protein
MLRLFAFGVVSLAIDQACLAQIQAVWANSADGIWSDPANWVPNSVPLHSGDTAEISVVGGYRVTLDVVARISGLRLLNPEGTLDVRALLQLSSPLLENYGRIVVTAPHSLDLNNTIVQGPGRISMADATVYGMFTNNPTHTFEGSGLFTHTFTNLGTIRASGGTLRFQGEPLTNNGVLEASTGAVLDLVADMYQSGGTISAAEGEARFTDMFVKGGSLVTTGAGHAETFGSPNLRLAQIIGVLNVNAGSTPKISGTPQRISGRITVNPQGTPVDTSLKLDWVGLVNPFVNCDILLNAPIGASSFTQAAVKGGLDSQVVVSPTTTITGNGAFSVSMQNYGTIFCSGEGHRLSLGTMENHTTVLAENGGECSYGRVLQTAEGLLLADGGTNSFGSNGRIEGRVIATGGGLSRAFTTYLAEVSSSGPLVIAPGSSTKIDHFLHHDGTIVVNETASATVTRLGATVNSAVVDGLTGVAEIILNAPVGNPGAARIESEGSNWYLSFGPNAVVTGNGQINTMFVNDGTIRCSGAGNMISIDPASAVTSNGLITATNGGVVRVDSEIDQSASGRFVADGGTIRFGPPGIRGGRADAVNAGRFETQGNLFWSVTGSSGDIRVLTGSRLSVGATSHDGSIFVGEGTGLGNTILNFNVSALNGSPRVVLRAGPGPLEAAQLTTFRLVLGPSSAVAGRGRLAGTITAQGLVEPGEAGNPVGQLDFVNSLQLAATSRVRTDLGGTAPGQLDRITGGEISVAGELEVGLLEGFVPSLGETFAVIEGLPVTGEFTSFARPQLADASLRLSLRYTPTRVLVEVVCSADFSGDGAVDFFDYLDFVAAYAAQEPSADFDANGQVDFFDYLDFVAAFDLPCG